MQAAEIIKQFKYSTLQIMAKDLSDQIDDRDSFFTGDAKPDPREIIMHANLVLAFGHVIKICCGEGGLPIDDPIHGGQLERLVDKYHPEIKSELRRW
jgi:hypothetical protein